MVMMETSLLERGLVFIKPTRVIEIGYFTGLLLKISSGFQWDSIEPSLRCYYKITVLNMIRNIPNRESVGFQE